MYPNLDITCYVTDNAANVVAASKELGVCHVPCFLHTVQLVVNNSIQAIKDSTPANKKVWEEMDDDNIDKLVYLAFISFRVSFVPSFLKLDFNL